MMLYLSSAPLSLYEIVFNFIWQPWEVLYYIDFKLVRILQPVSSIIQRGEDVTDTDTDTAILNPPWE